MKISKTLLMVTFFVTLSQTIYSQRAKDGNLTVATANNVVNSYTYLTANAAAGATTISVNNNAMIGGVVFGTALEPGDLIMIVQMQGANINCNTTPSEPAPGGWGDIYTVPDPYLWTFDWYNHIEDWGTVTSYNNAGKFEQVEVQSVSGGNIINLQCGLKNSYTLTGHVQIVRVPRFNDLTVSGGLNSIIPTLWNGQSGGIVAIEVEATLNINALSSISATGYGFRGGALDPTGNSGNAAAPNEVRFLGTYVASQGSEKGESILGFYTELDALYSRYGISGPANGGGGGGFQNCGGGGGSNIGAGAYTGNGVPSIAYAAFWGLDLSHPPLSAPTALGGTVPAPFVVTSPGGGRGGYALSQIDQNEAAVGPRNSSWGGDARKTNGGRGGHPLAYDATRIFFGGGGGSGDQDSGQGGAGGRGGGIVYITNYGTIIGSGTIEARGAAGQNTNPLNLAATAANPRRGIDGAGGGGAGGSIYIENAIAIPGSINLNAQGGNGGNQNLTFFGAQAPEAGGPGGSGAGGSIAFASGAPAQVITAGNNGVTNSAHIANFPPNGATSGATGIGSLPAPYMDLTALDVAICSGDVANLSVTLLGSLPAGGTIQWYTQQFGGGSVNSGLTYTTPALFATTTYYVGVCPGSGRFRIPIVVTVNPSQDAAFTMTPACDGGTATVTGDLGGTFSFDIPPIDLAVIDPNTGTITSGTSGNTYDVEYLTAGPCPDSLIVQVTASASDDPSFTTTPTCDGGTATVTGTLGGTFSFNIPPGDAAVIDPVTGTVSGGTPGGTYDILYATSGLCAASSVEVLTAAFSDDPSFTMTPTCDGGTATITGTLGGTFTFNVPPGDGAIIDGVTGTITLGTTGNSYDVMYATSGACAASSVQSVIAATDLTYTPTITDETCGSADGIIDLVASLGDGGPYQYSITGGAPYFASGTFTGLIAGIYNISILDNSGCEFIGVETVSSIGGPTIDNITPTNPSCAGACDGSITVTVSGGTPPYSYQWYDNLGNPVGIDDPTLSNTCEGDYSVEVTDAGGGPVNLFTEDFGSDGVSCTSQGTLGSGYNSGVGAWTTSLTGVNDADANLWFVSTMEEGVGAGNCGTGCSVGGPGINRTLHISNPFIAAFGLAADQGAAYNAGGGCPFFFCVDTDVRAQSPAINLAATGMTLTFEYIHLSDGTDQCEVVYFNGAVWNSLGILPNTGVGACAGGQHTWALYSWPIPVGLEGLANFQIGYRWFNNDDGAGVDPSVAIDNIQINYSGGGCPSFANSTLTDPSAPVLTITDPIPVCAPGTVDLTAPAVTAGSDAGTLTYWTDALATSPLASPSTVAVSATYYIQLDVAGCTVIQPVVATIYPTPTLVITDPAAICTPGTVDVTTAAVTAGSDPGTLTYWTDALATTPLGSPASVGVTGTYYIQLVDVNSCSVIQPVDVVINPTPTLIITDPAAVCSPGTVDLTAPAVTAGSDPGVLSYWTDALATSPLAGPSTVGVTATYYIQLVDGNSCSVVQPVDVVINPTPTLIITDPAAVCSPGTVDLTAPAITAGSDAGALTYWTDALATSSLGAPATVSITGTYYIQLVDGNSCSVIQPVDVVVNPQPTLAITDPAAVCEPATVDLTAPAVTAGSDPGVLSYWTDALATSPLAGPSTVGVTGLYYIQLVDGNSCSVVQPVNVVINPEPTFVISGSTDPSACGLSDGTFTISGLAPSTAYSIAYLDDGVPVGPSPIVTDALGDFVVTGLNAGSYTSITISDGTCFFVAGPVTLTDPAAPSFTLIFSDPTTCGGNDGTITIQGLIASTAYDLTYLDDAVSVGPAPIITDAGGDFVVTGLNAGNYTNFVMDLLGCTGSNPGPVTLNDPPAPALIITDPAAVCAPGTVDLTAPAVTAGSDAGALTYWTDALATAPLAAPTTVSVTATYYIQLVDGNSCSVIQSVDVVVNPQPTLAITDPAAVCEPATVDLTAPAVTAGSDPGVLSYWTDALATSPLAGPSTVGVTGTYYIQLVDGNSCSIIQPVNVVINPEPTFVISGSVDPSACGLSDGTFTISGLTPSTAYSIAYLDDGVPVGPSPIVTDALGDFVVTGLNAGNYTTITISDGTCSFVAGPVTLIDPAAPTFTLIFSDPTTCGGIDGTITIQGLMASTAYDLTYLDDAVSVGPAPIVTDAGGEFVMTGLNAGNYTNFVVDLLGCTGSNPGPVALTDPPAPALIITDPAAVCAPGTVDLTAATVTAGSDPGILTYWTDALATSVLASPNAVAVSNTYYIQLESTGCTSIEAVVVTIDPIDDASFTMTPTCDGGTATITGAAGGTFTFNIAPIDAAVINGATGTITLGTSGNSYDVLYTTNGTCPSSSVQSVTANVADDASFSMTPTCDGGTASVLGTPGGTFTFNIAPADAAVIDPVTGEVTGGTPGATYDIMYATSGGCAASTIESVTASLADDASFSMTQTCDGGTATILGTSGGTFTFNVAPADGAVIDPVTGEVTGGTNGATYDIMYATSGACASSTIESVTVIASDDASFNYSSLTYCANEVDPSAIITGLAGGTFSSLPLGLTIDPATGLIDLSASTSAGYTVTYLTNGTCPDSSNQSVTINQIPTISATNNGPVCVGASFDLDETGGNATSWSWTSNGAAVITNATDQAPSVTGAVDGEIFTVTGTDLNGCMNDGTTAITIIATPVLDPVLDVISCESYTLPVITGTNLSGNEAYFNDSQLNGGTTISGVLTSSQTVYIFDGSGSCTDEISFVVTINPLPTVTSITGGTGYCAGDVISDILIDVTGSPNWTINYTLDGVAQSVVGATSPISLGNAAGVYVLVDISDANCSNSASGTQTITIDAMPTAPNAGSDTTYCASVPFVNMTATGSGGTLTWYSDAALTTIIGTGGTMMPSTTVGTNTYYVTESNGNCEGPSSEVIITVNFCDITIPTAFTPDGDMTNDTWEILDLDNTYPDNRVTVYNRWGNLIFEHNSSTANPYSLNKWDGTFEGNLLPVASYFFIIEYNNGTSDSSTGSVSIILNK